MPSIFSRILAKEIPGRIVWEDDRAFAMLTIRPIRQGHTLLIPKQEVDHWVDLPADLAAHLFVSAQVVSRAIQQAFGSKKVGVAIAGLEVPHTHLHLIPIDRIEDLDFGRQDPNPTAESLDDAAERIRRLL